MGSDIARIKALLARVPAGKVEVDWEFSNHFEVSVKDDLFWLALRDGTKCLGENPWQTEGGQRLGLLLDTFVCMAGPVRELVTEYEALAARVAELEAETTWRPHAEAEPGQIAIITFWRRPGGRKVEKAGRSLVANDDGWFLMDDRHINAAEVLGWKPWPKPAERTDDALL